MQYLKKEKNKLIYIPFLLLGFVVIYLEVIVFNQFPIPTPNLTFIYIILFSLYFDGYYMPAISLLLGLLMDYIVGKFTGQYGLLFSLCSFIATKFNHNIRKDTVFAPLILCGGFFMLENISSYLLLSFHLENKVYRIETLLRIISISFLINMIFTFILVFIITNFISKKQVI